MSKEIKNKLIKKGINSLRNYGLTQISKNSFLSFLQETDENIKYYFKSQKQFKKEILDSFFEIINEEIRKTYQKDPKAAFKRMVKLVNWLVTDKKRTRLILNLIIESENNQTLQNQLEGSLKEHTKIIKKILNENAKPIDAQIIQATLWGFALQNYIYNDKNSKASATKKINRLIKWLETNEIVST